MTPSASQAAPYPRSHLLAASGVAALLSLALLVFPSREVEAKKTFLDLDLDSPAEQLAADPQATATEHASSPFALQTDAPEVLPASIEAPSDPLHTRLTVSRGDTLSTLLGQVGLGAAAVHELLGSSKDARRFSHLDVGQVLEVELAEDGSLKHLHSRLNDLESISLSRGEKGLEFKREVIKPELRTAYAHATINSSLFLSAKRAGLSHGLTMSLANVFGYDIDFAQDLREGDSFELIYEEQVVKGKVVGSGNILAARFTNRGKTYTAVRYTNKQGNVSYYNADGMSMRKAFIRTPVDFARISSRFSLGRKHPVLSTIRAHKGVDYAAPTGTPIKAAGDGKVILAGRRGGYGNAVIIQHGNSYRTLYGHMHGFAKGIRNGSTVRQGQIIGYVGSTGLSTGPHLHYEFQVNGRHVDPLSQKLPMADPIAAGEKAHFLRLSKPLMARMDQEKATRLASAQSD